MFLKTVMVYVVWNAIDPSSCSFFWSVIIGWWLDVAFGGARDDH